MKHTKKTTHPESLEEIDGEDAIIVDRNCNHYVQTMRRR